MAFSSSSCPRGGDRVARGVMALIEISPGFGAAHHVDERAGVRGFRIRTPGCVAIGRTSTSLL